MNKCVDAGCVFIFWVADWFALLNNKMWGDLEKIKIVGRYFVEVWKAVGMKMSNVKFLWTSDQINSKSNEYWLRVMDIGRRNNLNRIKRCSTIMGREESDDMSVAQMFYPCMQCTDIFFLKADICQLGMDQRKVNMLAREYCTDVKIKDKPVILSSHMVMGLLQGQEKMSKSDPNSAIFMEDTKEDVEKKIKGAFCPPGVVDNNPCMDYLKFIIFGYFSQVECHRKPEFGGDKVYKSYQEAEEDYTKELLHPGDLKEILIRYINLILQPVRDHFENDPYAKGLLNQVKEYQKKMMEEKKKADEAKKK